MRSDLGLFETPDEWRVHAACRTEEDPEIFFPNLNGNTRADGAPARAARPALRICRHCTVRTQCLQYALDHHPQWGIWGGTTDQQRQRMRPGRPALRVVS